MAASPTTPVRVTGTIRAATPTQSIAGYVVTVRFNRAIGDVRNPLLVPAASYSQLAPGGDFAIELGGEGDVHGHCQANSRGGSRVREIPLRRSAGAYAAAPVSSRQTVYRAFRPRGTPPP
jgi:hypothetical protein